MIEFRGRDILKRFTSMNQIMRGISYQILRNSIIHRMREDNHQPAGMRRVLDEILHS
jgi:hypothetical protein